MWRGMDAADFLKQTTLFSGLTDDELGSVMGAAKERRFPAGEVIIEEGAAGRGFYLLVEGTAQVRKGDVVLADFGPGDYFGEMSLLLDDTPRTATVLATSDVVCLVIASWDLRALIATHPDIGVGMMGELLKRLRNTDAAVTD
jgi:CRP/FNR family transcriptional regulator, cyclic AMP receptor protein